MFSIISIVVFIASVFLMNKMFFGFQPGSNKINSDVQRFRNQAEKWKAELVPWEQEELELLSMSEQNKVSRKGFGKSAEGVLQSIYHEPMLYYYYKEYPATSKNAILFTNSSKYEMVYRIKQKSTQVFVNEKHHGTIKPDGSFLGPDGQFIGKLDRSMPSRYEIEVGDKVMGSIIFPTEELKIRPRAFEIDETMDQPERLAFMIQGIYEIILYLANARPVSNLPAKTR